MTKEGQRGEAVCGCGSGVPVLLLGRAGEDILRRIFEGAVGTPGVDERHGTEEIQEKILQGEMGRMPDSEFRADGMSLGWGHSGRFVLPWGGLVPSNGRHPLSQPVRAYRFQQWYDCHWQS